MICVSIGRGRHKHMLAEHRHLVEQGAELVELRVDYLTRQVNLKRLLADRPGPVIFTCRREEDGGRYKEDEKARIVLLRSAIAEGVDYIDLEKDIASEIPRYGSTKRIISYHNFRETPEDLEQLHAEMKALDPDIIKIATMAHNPHDSMRMLQLIRNSGIPTVGICMGEIGAPTRILGAKFGSPFSYAAFHHDRTLAPGQFSFQQMKEIYHFDQINADTDIYGVIADPVGHSLSPVVHNAAFRHLNMNKIYVPFRVPREDLETFFLEWPGLGVQGLSVTIPHKEDVLHCLNDTDEAVHEIRACNTVEFKGARARGFNTDYLAAMASIEKAFGGEMGAEADLAGKTAMILGAGGVAKAIAYGLKERGVDVIIAGRTLEKVQELAKALDCRPFGWFNRHSEKIDLLVNGTPVGMHPQVDETPFEGRNLRASTVVFDTVYNPEQTLLIKEARAQGCRVITGVDMFIEQAALQFHLFTGQKAPCDVMRAAMKKAIGAANY